jgi:hypothetical protein
MTFHETKKSKPQQDKSRKTLLSWQGISKATALTNFRAFCCIVGAALDKHEHKELSKAEHSLRTLCTVLFSNN